MVVFIGLKRKYSVIVIIFWLRNGKKKKHFKRKTHQHVSHPLLWKKKKNHFHMALAAIMFTFH